MGQKDVKACGTGPKQHHGCRRAHLCCRVGINRGRLRACFGA